MTATGKEDVVVKLTPLQVSELCSRFGCKDGELGFVLGDHLAAKISGKPRGFGERLRSLRESYGMTMGDLSRALGCSVSALSGVELERIEVYRTYGEKADAL